MARCAIWRCARTAEAWATCGSDGVVRIWDAATRALQQELRDGQVDFIVAGACFVPGTDLVATCHWTGAARLWRGASCVATFTPAAPPTSAAPSTPPPAPEPAPVPPAAATPPPMVTPAAPPMAAPVPTPPPAPPAGGAWVHTETATLQLTVGSEVALPGPATPTLAFAPMRCSACGTDTVLAAPVRYVTHDDDHFGYLDLWYASVHRGACRQCRAALAVELSFTRRTLLTRQTLTFQLDTVRNATGGALAAPAAHTIPEPPLLPARSRAECQLYMTLRPCACGHAEPLRRYALLDSDAGPCAQYQDPCPRCGQARGFRFLLPRTDPPAGSLGGPEPSPLLCPGELALHADTLLRRVPPDTAALTAEQRATAAQEVRQAVQALEEVVRFLLPTATALAGECFTSAAGQALFQKDPGRFTRARLESRLAACRTLLAALRGR